MQTWKEKLPDYEFMLWNFERFDINSSIWVKQAFEKKKYAFAADYIRLFAVYHSPRRGKAGGERIKHKSHETPPYTIETIYPAPQGLSSKRSLEKIYAAFRKKETGSLEGRKRAPDRSFLGRQHASEGPQLPSVNPLQQSMENTERECRRLSGDALPLWCGTGDRG